MRRAQFVGCLMAFGVLGICSQAAWAQRKPPLVGTVSPGAIGPAAPTAVPIGGLRTRPLGPAPTAAQRDARRHSTRSPLFIANGVAYYAIADAPRFLGGVVIDVEPPSSEGSSYVAWIPTAERPRWVVDSTLTPVQAWRDLIVTDVVCSMSGTCVERQQRVRAPWVPVCRCYAFADGLNRVWRVE